MTKRKKGYYLRLMWFLAMLVVLSITACVQAPPQTAAQELERHRWVTESSGHDRGFGGSLNFDGDRLNLETVAGDRRYTLSGEYTADDKIITVLTDSGDALTMEYEIYQNRLKLGFSGKSVTFVKDSTVTASGASSS